MADFPYLYLLPVIPAGIMVVSDFRRRTVNLIWLVIFGISAIGISVYYNGFTNSLYNALFNTALVVYMLVCGMVYWRVRHGKWLNPVNNTMGSGDLIFIFFSAFLFDLRTFLIILLVSMIAGLIWWVLRSKGDREGLTIPFVGMSGIVVSLWLIKESLGL